MTNAARRHPRHMRNLINLWLYSPSAIIFTVSAGLGIYFTICTFRTKPRVRNIPDIHTWKTENQ